RQHCCEEPRTCHGLIHRVIESRYLLRRCRRDHIRHDLLNLPGVAVGITRGADQQGGRRKNGLVPWNVYLRSNLTCWALLANIPDHSHHFERVPGNPRNVIREDQLLPQWSTVRKKPNRQVVIYYCDLCRFWKVPIGKESS